MNVFFVSNSNPRFHNTNFYRARAMDALGHKVVFFDVRDYHFHPRLRAWFPALEEREMRRINRDMVRRGLEIRPDICVVAGGVEVDVASIRALRSAGIRCVLWTTDPPHPRFFVRILAAAFEYDQVFCAGTEAVDILGKHGYTSAVWLPFACDPALHRPVVLNNDEAVRYKREISFVGAYYKNRADIFSALTGFRLGIWGPLWNRLPAGSWLRPFVIQAHLDYSDWIRIYAAADIVLVVHFQDGSTPCHQASPKLYEALACGAFVLCDQQKDAQTLFKDGEHLVFFKDKQDLKEKAAYYLMHPQERERIAATGRAEVIARHTYKDRMSLMFTTVKKEC